MPKTSKYLPSIQVNIHCRNQAVVVAPYLESLRHKLHRLSHCIEYWSQSITMNKQSDPQMPKASKIHQVLMSSSGCTIIWIFETSHIHYIYCLSYLTHWFGWNKCIYMNGNFKCFPKNIKSKCNCAWRIIKVCIKINYRLSGPDHWQSKWKHKCWLVKIMYKRPTITAMTTVIIWIWSTSSGIPNGNCLEV